MTGFDSQRPDMKKPLIIAEVKTASPFGWHSDKNWDELFALAERVGDMISVHTDPRWGGSFELLSQARERTQKPILAKGIHAQDAEVEEALKRGANYVLMVGRIPNVHADQCLIEPKTLAELVVLPPETKAVWNSRDLATGGLKSETFEEARALWSGWLCQASNIRTTADIKEGADAVLVGTHLAEFAMSLKRTDTSR
jgi:indole-3-glycerol phosphate synthase